MSVKVEKGEQFSGKSDGISFEKLDEMVLSWGRGKLGDKYANLLWKDELTDLTKLDLTDELDSFEYDMHCTMVYDVLCYDSAKYADGLFETARFWTIQYQLQTRQRFREKMFCYLETIVKGEAARQIKKQGVRKMAKMRDFLFKRFGAGQPEILEERVRKYHLGLPDPKTGEAFPPRCDMEAKLDALEAEREYLVEMCPREQRENYDDGKESTLVRIILRLRPKEYDDAVKTVMDLHRFRLYAQDGDLSKITNLEDNSRVIYNSDWLPNYNELRKALIDSYLLQKRRRDENNQSAKKSPGHPVLPVLQGFDQPGPQERTCYGCGEKGHFKGDAECHAGPNDIWAGAPEGFKTRMKKGGKGKGKGGRGKGRGRGSPPKGNRQRNKKEVSAESDTPCKFWSSGNGYCKWGDNCRHSHKGKKGGKRKSSSVLLTSKDKKAKKELVTMVMNDLKSSFKRKRKEKSKEGDSDDELYDLVRGGKSTMMIQRVYDERDSGEDYIPSRQVIMMISSDESEDGEYSPKRDLDARETDEKNKREKPLVKLEEKDNDSSECESSQEETDSSDEESNNGKLESSSSVPTQVPHRMDWHQTESESWHLKYTKQQKRQQELLQDVNQRIENQNGHIKEMNKYLAHAKRAAQLQEQKDAMMASQLRRAEMDQKRTEKAFEAHEQRCKEYFRTRDAAMERLKKEIEALETRKSERWRELVAEDQWYEYEQDKEVQAIESNLAQSQAVYREERMLDSERKSPTSTNATPGRNAANSKQSSSEEKDVSPYNFMLIKQLKGEKKCYVNFLLNEKRGEYEGPFDLNTTIQQLIAHKERVHPPPETPDRSPSANPVRAFGGDRVPNVGLKEVIEGERTRKKRKEMSSNRPTPHDDRERKFQLGTKVHYFISDEVGNEKWHTARVMWCEDPGEGSNPVGSGQVLYRISPDYESGKVYVPVSRKESELRNWDWAKPCLVMKTDNRSQPLLPLNRVGIDTCSALSVSSRKEDFLWLDESKKAKMSVILRGVGGETASIGGRGPMVVEVLDDEGNKVVMFDPSAVYLNETVNQAGFRIFGQQRLKRFGFHLQQHDISNGGDILNYQNGLKKIPLETNGGILTLRTVPLEISPAQKENLEKEIDEAIKGGDGLNYCLQLEHNTSLIMNEAYLSQEEADRLHHWRIGHRSVGKTSLNETCPVCIEGKKKVGSFKRNFEFHGHTTGPILP